MPFPLGTVPGAPFGFKGANYITAAAGGGQANAVQLSGYMNHIWIVATAGDSVKLPAAYEALPIIIFNGGTNSLNVFPWEGDAITLLTATTPQANNLPVALASGAAMILVAYVTKGVTPLPGGPAGAYVGPGLWKQVV